MSGEQKRQWLAAALVLCTTFGLALCKAWPFDSRLGPLADKPSLAQLFLSDRRTLGFVRLALILIALFVIASIPALVVAGRWIKGFGPSGLPVDEAMDRIAGLKEQIDRFIQERNESEESAEKYRRAAAQNLDLLAEPPDA